VKGDPWNRTNAARSQRRWAAAVLASGSVVAPLSGGVRWIQPRAEGGAVLDRRAGTFANPSPGFLRQPDAARAGGCTPSADSSTTDRLRLRFEPANPTAISPREPEKRWV